MSKKTGAWLTRYALEQLPIKYTFGIPGVHNTEIYDELSKSNKIQPVLVTHEGGGAFIADGISRTSEYIGALLIVPAAGVTHAMSGIGEAFLDGVPMIVISGGIRTDTTMKYQLHEMDLIRLVEPITRFAKKITDHKEIIPTIFEAYNTAISGEPGPVFVEIPVNIQLFKGEIDEIPKFKPIQKPAKSLSKIKEVVEVIGSSRKIGMFLGWGAKDASTSSIELAELLSAPVSTTLQGFSVFPGKHPQHTGMGFGPASIPASHNAFVDIDCLIAVGTRFAEIPTGSFGCTVPENLIHIDINPEVFDKNFKARVAIESDARLALDSILNELKVVGFKAKNDKAVLIKQISDDKKNYQKQWLDHKKNNVNPMHFFASLNKHIDDDTITVVDDGNHTFLAAELFTVNKSRHFISPTDFNCMGYCVPAAIGAKLVNPDKTVIGIVGDGAFLMTALEILTATTHKLGIIYFVFSDGELSQISQGQQIPYNRKTCTVLPNIKIKGIAEATGASFLSLNTNADCDTIISDALKISKTGQPVIIDVDIDYSKKTRFTDGVVKTVLGRFPSSDKFRFIGRALVRKITK